MKRGRREVEIFSMSALDLFASAMGAFVLLAVMMLPYYFKGKEYEKEIGQLEKQLVTVQAKAAEAKSIAEKSKALSPENDPVAPVESDSAAAKLSAAKAENASLRARAEDIKRRIDEAAQALAVAPQTKPKATKKVTFRFLGLKTTRDRFLVLVDGARRIKRSAPNLPKILRDIVSVMGPGNELAIAFYRYANGRLVYHRWPDQGFREGGPATQQEALDFLRKKYADMQGGSATSRALTRALSDNAEAIILVSDGVIFPKHNEGLNGSGIVARTKAQNRTKTEIHSVAVGIFYKNRDFYTFLTDLSAANNGDLKGLPP